eukprot:g4479.t1
MAWGRVTVGRRFLSTKGAASGKDVEAVLKVLEANPSVFEEVLKKSSKELQGAMCMPLLDKVHREMQTNWSRMDRNSDGLLSPAELRKWFSAQYGSRFAGAMGDSVAVSSTLAGASAAALDVTEPTRTQLRRAAVQAGVPFIAFGFLDNFIMLMAGNEIEARLGAVMGVSALACAGLGNLISDVAGIKAGGLIESFATKMGLPDPGFTKEQLSLGKVKRVMTFSTAFGIAIGCVLGMCPLLWMDPDDAQLRKIFEEVDINGNGDISLEELEAASRKLGLHTTREELLVLVKKNDIDGDVQIGYEEFKSLAKEWLANIKNGKN